nr:hypothetical protein [uncultured Desulfuromonas sp.]
MSLSERETRHRRSMLLQWILWSAMTSSVAIYLVIASLVRAQGVAVAISEETVTILRLAGWIIAPVMLAASCRLRFAMIARYRQDGLQRNAGATQADSQPLYVSRVQTALIFSLALAEVPVIYGFILFLLGESFSLLALYAGVSLVANLFNRPKRSELEMLADAELNSGSIYTTKSSF